MHTTIYGPGTLAYLDTFAGLVPCKVLSINDAERSCMVRLTATRGAYKRSEVLQRELSVIDAPVPRDCVVRRRGTLRVVVCYTWRSAT